MPTTTLQRGSLEALSQCTFHIGVNPMKAIAVTRGYSTNWKSTENAHFGNSSGFTLRWLKLLHVCRNLNAFSLFIYRLSIWEGTVDRKRRSQSWGKQSSGYFFTIVIGIPSTKPQSYEAESPAVPGTSIS